MKLEEELNKKINKNNLFIKNTLIISFIAMLILSIWFGFWFSGEKYEIVIYLSSIFIFFSTIIYSFNSSKGNELISESIKIIIKEINNNVKEIKKELSVKEKSKDNVIKTKIISNKNLKEKILKNLF